MFSRWRNSMATLSEFYHHRLTSENLIRTGSTGTSRLPIFLLGGILWFYLYLCFSRSRNSMVPLSKLYHHWVDLENPVWTGNTGTLRLPIFFTGGISSYLPVFMFSRSRNSIVTLSELYHHRLTSKILVRTGSTGTLRLPICSLWWNFIISTYIYVFEVEEFNGDHFQNSTTTGWPRKSNSNRKYRNFKGYPSFSLVEFYDFYLYLCFRGRGIQWWPLSKLYHHWVDVENPVWTGNTGTLRLPIFFTGGISSFYLYLCFRGRGIQ